MKKVATLILILASFSTKAQFFTNVNSELCFELKRSGDYVGAFRVYMVIDPEIMEISDTAIFHNWNKLSQREKDEALHRWHKEGMRLESERAPYISYEPVFPNYNYAKPQKVNMKPNWKQWEKAKKYWQYPDRPF